LRDSNHYRTQARHPQEQSAYRIWDELQREVVKSGRKSPGPVDVAKQIAQAKADNYDPHTQKEQPALDTQARVKPFQSETIPKEAHLICFHQVH
jgi:hypothetical protein